MMILANISGFGVAHVQWIDEVRWRDVPSSVVVIALRWEGRSLPTDRVLRVAVRGRHFRCLVTDIDRADVRLRGSPA